jgi:hypothetical protein
MPLLPALDKRGAVADRNGSPPSRTRGGATSDWRCSVMQSPAEEAVPLTLGLGAQDKPRRPEDFPQCPIRHLPI